MSLSFVSINKGIIGEEYALFRATAACNLQEYVVLDTTYSKERVQNKWRHTYFLPNLNVKAGDLVCLWTGKGNPRSEVGANSITTHHFYWNLDSTVWNNTGDKGFILKYTTASSFTAP